MSKDDPTFSLRELKAPGKQKMEMNEEERRQSILKRTKHALEVSEKLSEFIAKRMQKFSLETSSSTNCRKRKADNLPMHGMSQKKSKESDGSSRPTTSPCSTYVNAGNLVVSKRQPKLLEGTVMRDYQLYGLDWLMALDMNGANGILADEMGLGKTLQVISLICFFVEMGVGKESPFLVIGPLTTLTNWVAEFQKFAPKIPVILYHGSKDKRSSLRGEIAKLRDVGGFKTYPVVVTSYQVPLKDPSLRNQNWRYLIIDEAHRLKNYQCLLIKELRRYKSTGRLLLTGTPLHNTMTELWSLLNFIHPTIVTDLEVFESWFDPSLFKCKGSEKIVQAEEKEKLVTTLLKILKPFLLRRVKEDVDLNLPPKQEKIVFAQMTEWQNRLYSSVVNKTHHSLKSKELDWDDPVAIAKAITRSKKSLPKVSLQEEVVVDEAGGTGRRRSKRSSTVQSGDYKLLANGVPLNALREEPTFVNDCFSSTTGSNEDNLLKDLAGLDDEFVSLIKTGHPVSALRQICNHPYLASRPVIPGTSFMKVDENIVQSSGKMRILDAVLPRLKNNGHKVLIFSNFTSMLDMLEEYLNLRSYQYSRLDGTRTLEDREVNIKKFCSEDDVFVFLISTRAGGLGINLVAADTVIFYDSDWNPQVDLQAQDRCHRIGQTKPVVVYRLVAKGTIDEHINNRADSKKQLAKLVIQHGKFKDVKENESVSLEELREILESKDYNEVDMGSSALAYTDEELDILCDRSSLVRASTPPTEIEDSSDLETGSVCSNAPDTLSVSSHSL